jgi:hypothetical protein
MPLRAVGPVLAVLMLAGMGETESWATSDALISNGYFIDSATIAHRPGGGVQVRVLHPKTKPTPDYEFDINTYQFDCERRTSKVSRAAVFSADGSSVAAWDPGEKSGHVRSSTFEDSLLKLACAREPRLPVDGDAATVVRKWRAIAAKHPS